MLVPGQFPPNLKPDARRFAALTKLQYERFKIWKDDDNFHLTGDNPPVPQSKLENLPAAEQPEQLTRAILEPTVGDSLLPGIEMHWIAKSATTVGVGDTFFQVVLTMMVFCTVRYCRGEDQSSLQNK